MRSSAARWSTTVALVGLLALSCFSVRGLLAADSPHLDEVAGGGRSDVYFTMHKYVPSNLPENAPLVVALHGCLQSAQQYAQRTGWNTLADRYGFCVLYPQQSSSVNPVGAFLWYDPAQIVRGQGEVLQLKKMIDRMKADHAIDPDRVFMTGFSAGAAMTAAFMACYPEVLSGGAINSGLPFRISTGINDAFPCMYTGKDRTPQAWGDLIRETHPGYLGPYPTLVVFHGTSDHTVNPVNQRELVDQWTNIHGADQTPEVSDTIAGHPHKVYHDANEEPVVETFEIKGMGHAITIDPGSGDGQGGGAGQYATDKNLYSSYWALRFWGIAE